MTARSYRSDGRLVRVRDVRLRRPRALDTAGADELDEWMVACPPLADPSQPSQ